jgi:hypothetical protein
MERVFIDREYSIAYVVMAIHSIYNSANKEITINDFINEIKTMPKVYKDDAGLMKSMKEILSKKEQYKIKITRKYNKK